VRHAKIGALKPIARIASLRIAHVRSDQRRCVVDQLSPESKLLTYGVVRQLIYVGYTPRHLQPSIKRLCRDTRRHGESRGEDQQKESKTHKGCLCGSTGASRDEARSPLRESYLFRTWIGNGSKTLAFFRDSVAWSICCTVADEMIPVVQVSAVYLLVTIT